MTKSKNGIYIIGDEIKFNNDKYPNDRYDRSLYIPKGYILPDGQMLTKEYARFHEDMAKRFIEENYYQSYQSDFIKDYKDYMLMRLHAMQIMCCGKNQILYCDDHINKVISEAIVSYLDYGWEEVKIPNITASYNDFLRFMLFSQIDCSLIYGGENEKKTDQPYVLKRCL